MADKNNLESLIDHSAGWNWENAHVAQSFNSDTGIEYNKGISINDIVESGTVLIAAGPADLDVANSGNAGVRIVPIGLLDSAQISMSRPLSRIFEIGSKLSYIIPGRVVGGIVMNRVFFDGPSLMKVVYAGEVKADYANTEKKFAKYASAPYGASGDDYQEFAHIGSGNLAVNLASSFFNQPVGLAFFFKDQQKDVVGQIYFEGCHISGYSFGVSASMNVLTESMNMEFVRCRPVITTTSSKYDRRKKLADINIVSAKTNEGP
jgi:hypothetical protein